MAGKHTAGPWDVGTMLNPANARAIIGDGDTVVAIMPSEWNDCTFIAANARLIAAAPDLLGQHEANLADLWLLRGAIHSGDCDREILMRVADIERRTEAAIQRATQPLPPPNEE